MSTQNVKNPVIIKNAGMTVSLPEAASQSFKKGQFVYLVSGKVTVCASNAASIYGIALQDATGVTDTYIDVEVIGSASILYGNVYHSTPASAITAVANVGAKYALLVTSNVGYVDIEDTDNDAFCIISLDNAQIGDTYGNVYFKVLPAVLQSEVAA